jgi:hypothetical protein
MKSKKIVRSLEDILAVIPVSFGFHPESSVVMIASGPDKACFQARIDMEMATEGILDLSEMLVEAAIQNKRTNVIFLFYTEDAELAEEHALQCMLAATRFGLQVLSAVRVDEKRYYPLRAMEPDAASEEPEGRPYDNSEHPFTLQAIYDGQVIHANRAERAAELTRYDAAAAKLVGKAMRALRKNRGRGSAGGLEQALWLQERLRRFAADPEPLDPTDAARVLDLIRSIPFRDLAWLEITDNRQIWQHLWLDLTQRASLLPDAERVAPAALLAFAAWQAGDGALAWCGVELCLGLEKDYHLAELVSDALNSALPPTAWVPPSDTERAHFIETHFSKHPDASAS